MPPHDPAQLHEGLTEATAAALLGVSPRMLRHLVGEGWIPRLSRGRYALVATVQGYIKYRDHLDEKAAARQSADAPLRRAKLQEVEQRIAMRDRELIDIREHESIFQESIALVGAEMAAVPRRLPRRIRGLVEREIISMVKRARQRFAERTADLVAGRQRVEAPED